MKVCAGNTNFQLDILVSFLMKETGSQSFTSTSVRMNYLKLWEATDVNLIHGALIM